MWSTVGRLRATLLTNCPASPDQLFEITLEPQGGTPYNKPSGSILYPGRAVKVM